MSNENGQSTSGLGTLILYRCPRCYLDIIEHTFYNMPIATQRTCGLDELEGLLVDEKEEYRKKIIEMVKKTENNDMLRFVYIVVSELKGIVEDEQNKN